MKIVSGETSSRGSFFITAMIDDLPARSRPTAAITAFGGSGFCDNFRQLRRGGGEGGGRRGGGERCEMSPLFLGGFFFPPGSTYEEQTHRALPASNCVQITIEETCAALECFQNWRYTFQPTRARARSLSLPLALQPSFFFLLFSHHRLNRKIKPKHTVG